MKPVRRQVEASPPADEASPPADEASPPTGEAIPIGSFFLAASSSSRSLVVGQLVGQSLCLSGDFVKKFTLPDELVKFWD